MENKKNFPIPVRGKEMSFWRILIALNYQHIMEMFAEENLVESCLSHKSKESYVPWDQ
uniref:Uncharacterized protein n=1 Tax=Romanomermis culicivorax TaxID=13658 RepID=A0A915KCM5_ROMCU